MASWRRASSSTSFVSLAQGFGANEANKTFLYVFFKWTSPFGRKEAIDVGVLPHQRGLTRLFIVMMLEARMLPPHRVDGQKLCRYQRWIIWRKKHHVFWWLTIAITSSFYKCRSTKDTYICLLVLKLFCFSLNNLEGYKGKFFWFQPEVNLRSFRHSCKLSLFKRIGV